MSFCNNSNHLPRCVVMWEENLEERKDSRVPGGSKNRDYLYCTLVSKIVLFLIEGLQRWDGGSSSYDYSALKCWDCSWLWPVSESVGLILCALCASCDYIGGTVYKKYAYIREENLYSGDFGGLKVIVCCIKSLWRFCAFEKMNEYIIVIWFIQNETCKT